MTGAVTTKQIGAIHALKAKAGLDEDSYRDVLAAETGKRSSKALSSGEALRVMERLKVLSGGAQGPRERVALVGPYAGICRALWISGWHLGVVRDRTDGALISFVRRQTGIDHLNWLRDAGDASRVIEALKKWLAREAGVDWPKGKADTVLGRQYAVYAAQQQLLGMPGLAPDELPTDSEALKADIAQLGAQARKRRGDGK